MNRANFKIDNVQELVRDKIKLFGPKKIDDLISHFCKNIKHKNIVYLYVLVNKYC